MEVRFSSELHGALDEADERQLRVVARRGLSRSARVVLPVAFAEFPPILVELFSSHELVETCVKGLDVSGVKCPRICVLSVRVFDGRRPGREAGRVLELRLLRPKSLKSLVNER